MIAAREPRLEAAIVADPDNLDNYRVYADWFLAQGDPRGELMALELAPSDDPRWGPLCEAVNARVMPHISAGLPRTTRLDWRYTFIDEIHIDRSGTKRSFADELADVLTHPSAFAVRRVRLMETYTEDNPRDAIAALARLSPRTLQRLDLDVRGDVGELDALYPFPIEHLQVGTPYQSEAVSQACVHSIVAAPWQLQSLTLYMQDGATLDDLVPLCARKIPLTELHLSYIRGPATALVRALIESPFADGLERLWIQGKLARADYKLLVEHRAQFSKLRDVLLPSRTFTKQLLGQ